MTQYMAQYDDQWLDEYSPLITNRNILELGSGSGQDSVILCLHALSVLAIDLKQQIEPIGEPIIHLCKWI